MEENFVTLFGVPDIAVDPCRKIRRLSLQDRNEFGDGLVGLWEKRTYHHARAVLVFPGSLDSLPSLHKFKHLRVLDLEDCNGLHAHHLTHLGRLFALRYLGLRGTNIDELPEEIGELQYLQTLDVWGTRIKEVPSSVGHLVRLVNLLCPDYVPLPDGFGKNMQALQLLVGVSAQSSSFVQGLHQLRNIRTLRVKIDGDVSEDVMSSLCTLGTGCLRSLCIEVDKQHMKSVMEPWSPTLVSLKKLAIWGICVPRVPRWIGSLDNLQDLSLDVEQLGVADFGLLGGLNALSRLFLWVRIKVADRSSSSEGTQRVKISGSLGFPSLRYFDVGSAECALGLLFEAGAMPKLKELHLCFDGDKTGSLVDEEFDICIHHLPCLSDVRCFTRFKEIHGTEDPMWDALKKALSSHPNNPKPKLSIHII